MSCMETKPCWKLHLDSRNEDAKLETYACNIYNQKSPNYIIRIQHKTWKDKEEQQNNERDIDCVRLVYK